MSELVVKYVSVSLSSNQKKRKSGAESPKDTILVVVRGQFHMTALPDTWCDPVATGWQGQGYNLDVCYGDSSAC